MRNAFTCDPGFLSPAEELVFLHLPLLVLGLAAVGLSASAIKILLKLSRKTTADGKPAYLYICR